MPRMQPHMTDHEGRPNRYTEHDVRTFIRAMSTGIDTSRKVDLIKGTRKLTGLGLKEAKDLVDQVLAEQ